jgi:PilZ domain
MHEIRSSILSGEPRAATPIARKAKPKGDSSSGLTKIAIRRQEARVTDQRAEDRLMNVVEQTTIVFRRKKHEARVVNVSSRGAMIEAPVEARIGEKLDIFFTEKNRTRCVVRWVRGNRVGIEFLNETIFWENRAGDGPVFKMNEEQPAAPKGSDPREIKERETRQALLRRGTLYWSGISIPVRLRNISAGGARVDSDRELVEGAEVELDLGEAGFQVAEVRWSRDGQVGLRFADEFNLDSLSPSSTASPGPAPDVLKPAYLETELRSDSPWAARFERLSMTDLKMIDPES